MLTTKKNQSIELLLELEEKIFSKQFADGWDELIGKVYNAKMLYYDDTLIGYYIIENNYLYSIGIIPEYRGKGIGNTILEQIVKPDMTLHVFVNDEKTINLYKKHGFEIVKTEKNFYDKDLDAFYMKKQR